jgi:hypothetical protein
VHGKIPLPLRESETVTTRRGLLRKPTRASSLSSQVRDSSIFEGIVLTTGGIGTAIALSVIPSSSGGSISVQIDGEAASTQSTTPSGGASTNQCIPYQAYARSDLPEKPHVIIVKNALNAAGSSGGTFEFNGITYAHFI